MHNPACPARAQLAPRVHVLVLCVLRVRPRPVSESTRTIPREG